MGAVLEFEITLSGQEPGRLAEVRVHVDQDFGSDDDEGETVEIDVEEVDVEELAWKGTHELPTDSVEGVDVTFLIRDAKAAKAGFVVKREGEDDALLEKKNRKVYVSNAAFTYTLGS